MQCLVFFVLVMQWGWHDIGCTKDQLLNLSQQYIFLWAIIALPATKPNSSISKPAHEKRLKKWSRLMWKRTKYSEGAGKPGWVLSWTRGGRWSWATWPSCGRRPRATRDPYRSRPPSHTRTRDDNRIRDRFSDLVKGLYIRMSTFWGVRSVVNRDVLQIIFDMFH